eukprot:4204648-Amphidinium_carterae.1
MQPESTQDLNISLGTARMVFPINSAKNPKLEKRSCKRTNRKINLWGQKEYEHVLLLSRTAAKKGEFCFFQTHASSASVAILTSHYRCFLLLFRT